MPYFQRTEYNMLNKFLVYAIERLPIIKTEDNDINLENVVQEIYELRKDFKEVVNIVKS